MRMDYVVEVEKQHKEMDKSIAVLTPERKKGEVIEIPRQLNPITGSGRIYHFGG